MTHSTEPKLFTIAELARNLDLPESTTRYYCNRFSAHLSSVGEGRRRRFKPEALETLRTIAQTMRRDKNAYAVDLVLRNDESAAHPHVPLAAAAVQAQDFSNSAPFAGQVLALMENQTRALQDIASAMTVFAERLSVAVPPASPHDVPPPSSAHNEENERLHQEIAALREQIRTSETVHQNDLEQLRKWLSRLGEALAAK